MSDLIQHRFYRDRAIKSPRTICDALNKGREVHALLWQAANGDEEALKRVDGHLSAIKAHSDSLALSEVQEKNLKSIPPARKLPKIAFHKRWSDKFWAERIPDPIPMSERPAPLERISGPRRVPMLASATGFPFLRYKSGAQSPKLSRVLRQLLKREQHRWTTIRHLEWSADVAKFEDHWDRAERKEPSWADAMDQSRLVLHEAISRTAARKVSRAEEFYKIMKAEEMLAEQEKASRKIVEAPPPKAPDSKASQAHEAQASEKETSRKSKKTTKISRARDMGKAIGEWKHNG